MKHFTRLHLAALFSLCLIFFSCTQDSELKPNQAPNASFKTALENEIDQVGHIKAVIESGGLSASMVVYTGSDDPLEFFPDDNGVVSAPNLPVGVYTVVFRATAPEVGVIDINEITLMGVQVNADETTDLGTITF